MNKINPLELNNRIISPNPPTTSNNEIVGYNQYMWLHDNACRIRLHPSVVLMMNKYETPSTEGDFCLEWPHVSGKEPTRLAYTPNIKYGTTDRKLVTSIGKYIARHWPHVADHDRRNVQSLFTPDTFKLGFTMPEIITAIELGPRSCMASEYGSIPFSKDDNAILRRWLVDGENNPQPEWRRHPYFAYAPSHGWHMAYRVGSQGVIHGRAVCLTRNEKNMFVRSYARGLTDEHYSETDHGLEAWLKEQGYLKVDGWPNGTTLLIGLDPELAPYVDGQLRTADRVNTTPEGHVYRLTRDGEYLFENTNGGIDSVDGDDDDEYNDDDDYRNCECCEARVSSDEITYVERHEETPICESCLDNRYTQVVGRAGNYVNEYYTINENAVEILGHHNFEPDYADRANLPNTLVWLSDQEGVAALDECVCVNDQMYLATDDNVALVWTSETESDWGLVDDAYHAPDGKFWADRETFTNATKETV